MTPLEIRALEGSGAEVFGADVTELTVGDWNQVQAAFAAFGALVFRDQVLDQTELAAFANRWVSGASAVDGDLVQSANVEVPHSVKHALPGLWVGGDSYRRAPSVGAAIVRTPTAIGSAITRLSSLTTAFDALTTATQRELEGLTATHDGPNGQTTSHPVVIHHPVSGRKTLYLNPQFTTSIDDMNDIDGLALINQLTEHCQRAEFIGQFDWEPGTLLLIDHRATWRFDQIAHAGDLCPVGIAGNELAPARQPDRREPTIVERAGATLAGGVITAAMTGIADVIEPEKSRPEIEIVAEAPEQEPLTPLDFGGLPPLD